MSRHVVTSSLAAPPLETPRPTTRRACHRRPVPAQQTQNDRQQSPAERAMAVGLRALNRFASSDLVDRFGLRHPAERFLSGATKTTARTAARAGRTFVAAQKLARPARQPRA